ncbi:MAG: lysine--tRNA ligase [Parachlamydiales bacterium]
MFSEPDYHHQEDFQVRKGKLAKIREMGIDPYPPKFAPTHHAAPLLHHYEGEAVGDSEAAAEGKTAEVAVAGRLVLFRAMGKNAFGQLQDGTGRLQVMFNREGTQVVGFEAGEEYATPLKFIEKLVDLGDFLGVEGHLFRTGKGELTLFVKRCHLLAKSLLPLPDKHSGIVDKEVRYRKRWLDLISHSDVVTTFKTRSRIVSLLRHSLEELGFMEVETPILQSIYGGAAAKPFVTHLNALKHDMFLRISLEIPLKKLIVGGMERIFEIGKVFRNEGIDKTHNPEFTLVEAYAAYWDYRDVMVFMERLCERIARELFGEPRVRYTSGDEEIVLDFTAPWKRLTMKEAIGEYAGIEVDRCSDDEMRAILKAKTPIDPDAIELASRGVLISFLFEELAEPHLIQPHHILDHPIETTPLCKPHRDPKLREEGLIERFESFILGKEICNAYSELNDPVKQRELLIEQAMRRDAGDEEANPLDEEFIEAICQGMPPTGGWGMGVDRLVMLLTGAVSIRDVLYFPMMRSEVPTEEGEQNPLEKP